MDKIDRIIQESIDNLINEARRGRDPWAGFEAVKTRVIKPDGNAINVVNANSARGKKTVDQAVGRPEKVSQKRMVKQMHKVF